MIIELVKPDVSGGLLKLKSNEIKRAKEYFNRLVDFQNLSVKKVGRNDNGMAQFGSKTIWVPTIRNKSDFMTCLHEVGHSIDFGSILEGRTRSEYEAEMFAVRRARHFGLDDTFLIEYEKHSKLYVAAYLDAGFHLNKSKWSELSLKVQEVATWLGVTAHVWDSVTELPFSNKLKLPPEAIELNSVYSIPYILQGTGSSEQQITDFELSRVLYERVHSNFDLLTRDLIRASGEAPKLVK
jgi:hypothetical protein